MVVRVGAQAHTHAARGGGVAELSSVRGGHGARGPAAPSQLVAVCGRAGRGREKGGGGRKRKEEKEKEKGKKKRKRKRREGGKKRKRKGGAGGIRGDGREPVAASTRSDVHEKRGE